MVETQESATAKLCSFARAYHSGFAKEKIFDDYLAHDLMGTEGRFGAKQLIEHAFHLKDYDPYSDLHRKLVCHKLDLYFSAIVLSRSAFAEKKLMQFAEENEMCQYIIFGAGIDTFAFRNQNPRIQIYEVDHPDTQRYKLRRINQLRWNIPQNVHYAAVDFEKDDMAEVLLHMGFCREKPAYFAMLGILYYMTPSVLEQTMKKISRLASIGSQIVFDFPDETTFAADASGRVKELRNITASLGEPMQYGYSVEEIRQVLQKYGFYIRHYETPEMIQKHYFENNTEKLNAFENVHFILAEKRRNSYNEYDNFYI